MSSYSQLKVAELRHECDQRRIDRRGLKKPQMIAALRAFDEANGPGGSDVESDGNDEMVLDEGDRGEVSDSGSIAGPPSLPDPVGEEPESVAVLKLKLALAEQKARMDERDREWAREARERGWEIEKERMAMQNQNPPRPQQIEQLVELKSIICCPG